MSCDRGKLEEIQGEKERVKFFDDSQIGGKAAGIFWNGWIIWENGTSREITQGFTGVLRDATWVDKSDSQQVRDNLWFRIRYYQTKLYDSIKFFEQAKAELIKRASDAAAYGGQPPTVNELKSVRRLRHTVKGFEKTLTELFEILNPSSEPYVYSEQERKIMNQNRDEGDKILDSLKTLEV